MTRDPAVHRNILISILKDIFRDSSLSPFLGFKGGTAAMLFYELPRFSVDLDFDLLDDPHEEEVFDKIKKIVEKYGTVRKLHNKRNTLFFLLSYEGKVEGASNIKVEINKRKLAAHYHVMSFLGIAMRVMVKADMAAHKMMAFYNRLGQANRDIFDVWFFLQHNWPINETCIEERMGMSYKEFLTTAIAALENYDDRQILTGLGELLTVQQRTWVKANLKEETLFLLRLALSNKAD